MRFGKRHEGDEDRPDEPVGIEALHASPHLPDTPAGKADGHAAGQDDAGAQETPGSQVVPLTQDDAGATAPDGLDADGQEAYAQLKRLRAERRKKKLVRRGVVAGALLVALAGTYAWRSVAAQQAAQQAVQVITQPVVRAPFSSEVTGQGSIKPISSTIVSPEIDGTIESVNVVSGQQVAAGDVLFTVKNDDLDRAVAEAGRGVRSAQSALDDARRGASQASQELERARAASSQADEAVRAAKASAPSASAPSSSPEAAAQAKAEAEALRAQAISEAESQRQAAADAVTAAEEGVSSANSGVEAAQLQLESANDALAQAQAQADKRVARAPIAGSVIELNAQPGASVGQAAASAQASGGTGSLCQIADLSQMTVTVQVSEVDVNKVQTGQAATATFSAVPDVALAASVRSIASTASSSGGTSYGGMGGPSGSSVTYAVDLVLPEPDERLKPGMTASVSITTQALDTALVVPVVGLTDYGDGTGVLAVEDDAETHEAHSVSVRILATNGSEAAVEPLEGSDLREGDAVIVSGSEAASISGDAGVGAPGAGSSGASGGASYVTYDEDGNVTGAGGSAAVD